MILFKKSDELKQWLDRQQKKGLKAGFVPTMGALHPGHLSLVEQAKKENEISICSIFVNPTQFNDPKDFEKYPVTIENDIKMLEEAGCNVLFLPSVKEMYPGGTASVEHFDLGSLETLLEGKYRPGHYQGVCQVVKRLLQIVEADNLYLGQKDYQQCMVITRLVELMGKKEKIRIQVCPTLREADGLAMSSRNMRLNPDERKKATAIYHCLSSIKSTILPGNLQPLLQQATEDLVNEGFRVDYVEIADAATLEPVLQWDGRQKLVALVAAFLNDVRLIDNMPLN